MEMQEFVDRFGKEAASILAKNMLHAQLGSFMVGFAIGRGVAPTADVDNNADTQAAVDAAQHAWSDMWNATGGDFSSYKLWTDLLDYAAHNINVMLAVNEVADRVRRTFRRMEN